MSQATLNNTKQSELLDKCIEFVLTYGHNLYSRMEAVVVREFLEKHMLYGTMMVCWDKGSIVAIVRWNWKTRTSAQILDLIIHPDYRNKRIMQSILVRAMVAYPWLKTISFHRKKHDRDVTCLVTKFLGGN